MPHCRTTLPFRLAVIAFAVIGLVASAEADDLPLPGFVEIPAGEAILGSVPGEPGRRGDEMPRIVVAVERPFLLAATEVTAELWRAVMETDPSYFPVADGPAESMTWFEALDFCNVLSARAGLEPVYEQQGGTVVWNQDADGYRLPTELEWEYACRAGTATTFATGDCLSTDDANYDATRPGTSCARGLDRHEPLPVGSFPANAWGLHDMHGNVGEWCWNVFWRYGEDEPPGPGSTPLSDLRAVRGGGWISLDTGCRSAVRFFIPPDSRYGFVGLRLARNAGSEAP